MNRFETNAPSQRDVTDARSEVERLFTDHASAVFGYAARRLGRDVGGEVTAEAFAIALERWSSFDPTRGTELGWLYGIASNLIRRHWRTEERRLRAIGASVPRIDTSTDPLLRVEQRADAELQLETVIALITGMDSDDCDLLMLTAWEQLGPAEVAEALGIPVGTVKSRLSRLRSGLRRQREENDHE
ncbi:MAG: putative polymerase subfamily sigma factor [Ilumatobacteraceae bacterium]|nr:putative polymerase subfamily sigma factor [Ilumatobacteraceae bacterium]